MAILTDVFISSPAEALRYEECQAAGQTGAFNEGIQLEGLTNLEFGTLWAIIDGKEFDFDKHAFESPAPQGETWLFRFPGALVQLLATLTPPAIMRVAPLWAETDEIQWDAAYAEEVLMDLVRLAKLANSSSKGLFFWGSL